MIMIPEEDLPIVYNLRLVLKGLTRVWKTFPFEMIQTITFSPSLRFLHSFIGLLPLPLNLPISFPYMPTKAHYPNGPLQ